MRESSWSDCLESRNSLKISEDKEKAALLIETAEGRVRFFIRDELKRNDIFNLFDDLRYKRNSLVYYGNTILK